MKREIKTHESYGMCAISRTTGGTRALFGSNLKHDNTIRLTISTAELDRHLNQDWFHSKKELIEIEMSPLQYAELISNPNTSGVPVTIKHVNRDIKEEPPFESPIETASKEFKSEFKSIGEELKQDISKAHNILSSKKAPNKTEKQFLSSILDRIDSTFKSHVPFVKDQFDRMVDKSILEAKSAIESYHLDRIVSLGTEAYKRELELKDNDILKITE